MNLVIVNDIIEDIYKLCLIDHELVTGHCFTRCINSNEAYSDTHLSLLPLEK